MSLTTQGMGPLQLELAGKMMFGEARLASLGPFLFGMWFDAMGLGLIIALFVRWQMAVASSDKPLTRILVYYLLLVNFGMSVYILAYSVYLFVRSFGEYKAFLNTDWSRVAFAINAASRIPAASFFAHRVWLMYDKHVIIPIVLAPLLLAMGACSFAVTATYTYHPIPILSRKLIWSFCSCEVASDVIITVILAVALFKRKTGWDHTDKLITRLLRLLVETQVPPTLAAAAFFIVTMTDGDSTNMAFFQSASKVHTICLLIVISSRVDLSKSQNHHSHSGRHSKFNGESIELGSTDSVRVDRTIYVHSAPQDSISPKRSVNRAELSENTDELKYDYPANTNLEHSNNLSRV